MRPADSLLLLVMLVGPALVALFAVIGVVLLYHKLNRAEPSRRPLLWIGIGLLGALAFGIGSCYAVVLSK